MLLANGIDLFSMMTVRIDILGQRGHYWIPELDFWKLSSSLDTQN
jgi:hypothetical protein